MYIVLNKISLIFAVRISSSDFIGCFNIAFRFIENLRFFYRCFYFAYFFTKTN